MSERIEPTVYAKLHETRFEPIEAARRARADQARLHDIESRAAQADEEFVKEAGRAFMRGLAVGALGGAIGTTLVFFGLMVLIFG